MIIELALLYRGIHRLFIAAGHNYHGGGAGKGKEAARQLDIEIGKTRTVVRRVVVMYPASGRWVTIRRRDEESLVRLAANRGSQMKVAEVHSDWSS